MKNCISLCLSLCLGFLIISCQQSSPQNYRTEVGSSGAAPANSSNGSQDLAVKNPECKNNLGARLQLAEPQGFGIVGGTVAQETDPVVQSTLKVILPGGHCTGTLIGDRHVLTAAHCFEANNQSNKVAVLQNPSTVKIGGGVNGQVLNNVRVKSFVVHPCYQGILGDANTGRYLEQVYYDVALLTLENDISSEFSPVQIASPSELESQPRVTIAGYGAYSQEDNNLRPLTRVDTFVEEVTDLQEIQLEVNGRGACFGDSGGPTYISLDSGSTLKLVGSTTGPGRKSNYSCDAGSGTMMDITTYRGWIDCSFKQMDAPLSTSTTDDSSAFCQDNNIIGQ